MSQIIINNLSIEVVRKNIQNLRLVVYPPDGRVHLSVPLGMREDAIRQLVVAKMDWIKRQQARLASQARPPVLNYRSGEMHDFLGQQYELTVVERDAAPQVLLRDPGRMLLYVRPGASRDKKEQVLRAWYRQALKERIAPLIARWEPKLNVQVAAWGVKRMKTRWGTCNVAARRIWLNLELARWPERSLEYILVHEMVHLLERRHGRRFRALMTEFLPNWQLLKDELNHQPRGEGVRQA